MTSPDTGYIGIWHGGTNYRSSEWERHAEWFKSLEDALEVLQTRFINFAALAPTTGKIEWGMDDCPKVVGDIEKLATPLVDETCKIELVPAKGATLFYIGDMVRYLAEYRDGEAIVRRA